MPRGGGGFGGSIVAIYEVGVWTSENIWGPHSWKRYGIENFEGYTYHTLSDYSEASTTAACSYDNTTFTMITFNPPPNGLQVRKMDLQFASSTTNMCGQEITLGSAEDWTDRDKLFIQVYGDGNSNKLFIQVNQGGVWGTQHEVTTINWSDWQEVEFDLTTVGTRDDVRGIRILVQENQSATGHPNAYTIYIDLLQIEDNSIDSEFGDLIFAYSMPMQTSITIEFYDYLDDSLLKAVALSGSSGTETLQLSSYSELFDKDFYAKIRMVTQATFKPSVDTMTIDWRQDQIGDWSLRSLVAGYTAT